MSAPSVNSPSVDLLGLSRTELESLGGCGKPPNRTLATKIFKSVHRGGETNFTQIPELGKAACQYLSTHANVQTPRLAKAQKAIDGTQKWLLQLDDGEFIETVFIPSKKRGTLCISSQVGCPLKCAFCATGRMGFKRNLSSAEIVGQVWLAKHSLLEPSVGITNVVLMGMGEPLLNFDAVVAAMRIIADDCAYGLGVRHITLSTAGHVAGINKLAQCMPVNLAVSLHAPDDDLRDQLVPLNRKYRLAELLQACREYAPLGAGFVTFEYTLLDQVNASAKHAYALVNLLRDTPCKINLLPFNDFHNAGFKTPSAETVQEFYRILIAAGYVTTIRQPRGSDIEAACGQLFYQNRQNV